MKISLLCSAAVVSLLALGGPGLAQSENHRSQEMQSRSAPDSGTKSEHSSKAVEHGDSKLSADRDTKDRSKAGSDRTERSNSSKNRDATMDGQASKSAAGDRDNRDTASGSRDKLDRQDRKAASDRHERDENRESAGADRTRGHSETADRDRGDKRVSLDSTKRSRISETIRNEHVENLRDVDFDIRVGGVVPDHHRFNRLPAEIVEMVPEYRGYDYLVANNEIVIVEPGTRKIVYSMKEGRSSSMDRRSTDCR